MVDSVIAHHIKPHLARHDLLYVLFLPVSGAKCLAAKITKCKTSYPARCRVFVRNMLLALLEALCAQLISRFQNFAADAVKNYTALVF